MDLHFLCCSSQYILLNFYKREPFCNSRDGIRITRLQFTNDLSIFEQVNMDNMTPLKFCLERLKINFLESSIIVGKRLGHVPQFVGLTQPNYLLQLGDEKSNISPHYSLVQHICVCVYIYIYIIDLFLMSLSIILLIQ